MLIQVSRHLNTSEDGGPLNNADHKVIERRRRSAKRSPPPQCTDHLDPHQGHQGPAVTVIFLVKGNGINHLTFLPVL